MVVPLRRGGLFAFGEAGDGTRLGAQSELRLLGRDGRRRRRRQMLFGERLTFDEELEFGGVENFAIEKGLGDALEGVLVSFEDVAGAAIA